MSYSAVAGPAIDDVTAGQIYVAMAIMAILGLLIGVVAIFLISKVAQRMAGLLRKERSQDKSESDISSARGHGHLGVPVMAGPIFTQQEMSLIHLGLGVVAVLVAGILGYLIWRLAERIVDFFWARHESQADAQD